MGFDCDKWISDALSGLDASLPASHEPMLKAQSDEAWVVWREMGQRQIRASGERVGVQHNLRLTVSFTETMDYQRVTRIIQEALQEAPGCVYARNGGDMWNQESRRRECTLYVGILEVV